jgi:Protein of unknown function (DUF742)
MGVPAETGPADEPAAVSAGARFPSARQVERLSAGEPEVPAEQRERKRGKSRPSGARFPSDKHLERYSEPAPEPESAPFSPSEVRTQPLPKPSPAARREAPSKPQDEVENSGPRARPYVLTRGRTHSTYELALETMVSLRNDAQWTGTALSSEYQPVRALCGNPQSVAEVAATLSMPLGVARVLLSDMAELGLLHIHGTERTAEGRPPMALMRRVLDGLQRI